MEPQSKIVVKLFLVITLLLCSYLDVQTQYYHFQEPFGGQPTGLLSIYDSNKQNYRTFAYISRSQVYELNQREWVNVDEFYNNFFFVKLLSNDNILYSSFDNFGLYKYTYEKNWEHLFDLDTNEYVIALSSKSNDKIIATLNSKYFMLSDDNMQTWKKFKLNLKPNFRKIEFINDSILIASSSNGIFISNDLGENWTLCDTANFRSLTINDILVEDNNKIFACTNAGLYKSDDGGYSWNEIKDGIYVDWINTIFKSKDNDLYLGTSIWTYYSTDGGNSWTGFTNNLHLTNVTSFANLNDSIVIAASNYGIYSGSYAESGWTEWNQGFNNLFYSKILSFNNDGQNNLLLSTTNKLLYRFSENNWTTSFSGLTFNAMSRSPWGHLFLSSGMGGVLRSTDNGKTFEQFYSNYSRGINEFAFDNKGNVYGALNNPTVVRSSDNGETWELFQNGLVNKKGSDIAINSKNFLYLVTSDGLLYKSQISTCDWVPVILPFNIPNIRFIEIGPDDAVYIKSDALGLIKTNDDFLTAKVIFPNKYIRNLTVNKWNQIIAASLFNIYLSNDNGKTWDMLNGSWRQGFSTLQDLTLTDDNHIIILTSRDIFVSDEPTIVQIKIEQPDEMIIYPNPVKNTLLIDFLDNYSNFDYAEIIDYSGRTIIRFEASHLLNHKLDVSGLNSGQYIIRLNLDNHTFKFAKFIKL